MSGLSLSLGLAMSAVTDFLAGKGKDHRSRGIEEILAFDDEHLEGVHDYIQWLFPLPESSAFNTFAPILTFSDIYSETQHRCSPEYRGSHFSNVGLLSKTDTLAHGHQL